MGYLLPAQYEAYGLGAETPDALITLASAVMDTHCRRPSLLAAEYVERIRFTAGSQTGRLSYGPVAAGAVTGIRVRYARGRRGEAVDLGLGFGPAGFGSGYPAGLDQGAGHEIAAAFGLPGTWSVLDPATIDLYLATREITFPTNVLGLGYNEAEVTYTAGLMAATEHVMAACAQIVRNAQAQPALAVKSSRLDTLQMQYFGQTLIDDSVRVLLRPYVAERLS